MAYLKPQSPLQQGSDYIYPITTADQIIIDDNGTRLGDGDGNVNINDQIARDVANAAMPKSGGLFTGTAMADNTPYSGGCIRNIEVKSNDALTYVPTGLIYFVRK